jgi:hypothetical protein
LVLSRRISAFLAEEAIARTEEHREDDTFHPVLTSSTIKTAERDRILREEESQLLKSMEEERQLLDSLEKERQLLDSFHKERQVVDRMEKERQLLYSMEEERQLVDSAEKDRQLVDSLEDERQDNAVLDGSPTWLPRPADSSKDFLLDTTKDSM